MSCAGSRYDSRPRLDAVAQDIQTCSPLGLNVLRLPLDSGIFLLGDTNVSVLLKSPRSLKTTLPGRSFHFSVSFPTTTIYQRRQVLRVADHCSLTIKELGIEHSGVLPEISAGACRGSRVQHRCASANGMLVCSKGVVKSCTSEAAVAQTPPPSLPPVQSQGLRGTRQYLFIYFYFHAVAQSSISFFLGPTAGRLGIQESPVGNRVKMTYLKS